MKLNIKKIIDVAFNIVLFLIAASAMMLPFIEPLK
jgi:hypothetical protein